MKKITIFVFTIMLIVFFSSCTKGTREDKNGNTPTNVVEKMYEAIKAQDYEKAASYNKFADTIRIEVAKDGHMYKEFKDIEPDNNNKYVINGDNWKSFVIEKMKEHCSSYKLESYEVTSEEISKTDPNSAKVKTKINITTSNGKSELECSFPLKRENDTWFIIG